MKIFLAVVTTIFVVFSTLSCATVDPVRRFPGMVADMDPIPVGTVYAVFDRAIGRGLNTVSMEAVFHPRLNAVALEFRHEFVTIRQFWDETARRHFAMALDRYNADFEARELINQHRRTRNAYGSVSGRLEWQTARFTTVHVSYPVIEIGYRFRDNAPFFATLMRPARSEPGQETGATPVESRQLQMYFTRAQAADIVRVFDQAYLMGLLEMHGAQRHNLPLTLDEFPMDGVGADGYRIDEYGEFYDEQALLING